MKYISVQPDTDYFVWQVRVQLNNFRKLGIEQDAISIFVHDLSKPINPAVLKLAEETKGIIVFFPDRRDNHIRKYVPSVRPHALKTFYQMLGADLLFGEDVFYHDADIIFSSLPDFKKLGKKKKVCVSDTISYVGANYIKSKSEKLLQEMCDIVGVSKELVEKNEAKSGGAQYYIPKGIYLDFDFWEKVEQDSVELYKHMINTSSIYTPTHPIQAWTADMWAVLWNFWLDGHDSAVVKELDFSWPMFSVTDWEKYHIFHNAGVTPDRKDLFYKAEFIDKSPFDFSHENVDKNTCSIKYVEEILETAKLLKK